MAKKFLAACFFHQDEDEDMQVEDPDGRLAADSLTE